MLLFIIFLSIVFCLSFKISYGATVRECVKKEELKYNVNGDVSVKNALDKCIENIADAQVTPLYMNATSPVEITITVYINNLISVSELQNSATLDFFLYFQWNDPRFYLPALYDEMKKKDPKSVAKILDLTYLAGSIWRPQFAFPEVTSNTETDFYLRLDDIDKNTTFSFLSHRIVTTVQTAFSYEGKILSY